jgi:hypothetical protein
MSHLRDSKGQIASLGPRLLGPLWGRFALSKRGAHAHQLPRRMQLSSVNHGPSMNLVVSPKLSENNGESWPY